MHNLELQNALIHQLKQKIGPGNEDDKCGKPIITAYGYVQQQNKRTMNNNQESENTLVKVEEIYKLYQIIEQSKKAIQKMQMDNKRVHNMQTITIILQIITLCCQIATLIKLYL